MWEYTDLDGSIKLRSIELQSLELHSSSEHQCSSSDHLNSSIKYHCSSSKHHSRDYAFFVVHHLLRALKFWNCPQ